MVPLRRKLSELAAEEFRAGTRSVHLIERENVRSARLQRLLELAVIRDLIYEGSRQVGSTASLNRVFSAEWRSSASLVLPFLQVYLQNHSDERKAFCLDLQILTGPPCVTDPVPRMLVEVSLDAARAIADSYKVRGGSVPVRTLLEQARWRDRAVNEKTEAGRMRVDICVARRVGSPWYAGGRPSFWAGFT